MPCPGCARLEAEWPQVTHSPDWKNRSDLKCAFESGVFSTANWCCGTMHELREKIAKLVEAFPARLASYFWEDHRWVLYALDPPDEALLLAWYKERGRTDTALIIAHTDSVHAQNGTAVPLTLEKAEAVLAALDEDLASIPELRRLGLIPEAQP